MNRGDGEVAAKQATLSGGRDSGHQLLGSKLLQIQPLLRALLFQCTVFSLELLFVIDTVPLFCLAFCLALVPRVLVCTYADPGLLCLYISVHFAMSVRLILRFAYRFG